MHVKIVALVSAGTPPDGMSAPSTRSSELIMRKILREIDSYVAKDKGLPLADVYPARLDNYRLNNTLYALPVDNGTGAVYYNKELFDRAGVPYPKDDWTWDDLYDKARRLTRKDGPEGAVYGFQYPTSLHNFYALFAGQGGEYFDKNLTKVAFDTGGSVKALQWFLDLRCKEGLAPTPEQVTELRNAGGSGQIFGQGRYAMEYGWYGVIRDLHTPQSKIGDKWDVAPIPQPANAGKRYNVVGGQGFAVINGARHPDAAYAYARFLISDEGHKLLRGTWNPSRRSMAKLGQPDDGIPKNFVAAFADMVFKRGFSPWWYVPGYTEWEQAINQELAPCWRCERTADTAARTLAPVVNDMIKQRPTSF
jgi:multiple sugar transport system substrate-binding protein